MSRYIDAEWLKELYKPYKSYNGKELAVPIGAILANIDDAPSIDIVRCKECRYWHREINGNGVEYINFSKCTKGHHGNGLDFYCADGEREDE